MIAEVVGPAGAGKTTLAQAISQRNSAIQFDPQVRFRQFLPAFYARAFLSLPAYLFQYRKRGSLFWQVLLRMAYVDKLHHVLAKYRSDSDSILFLDQGSIFWLTYLHKFGFAGIRNRRLDQWWTRNLDQCRSMLDVIIWVDAPDSVLMERIHGRSEWHRVQDWSEQMGVEYLVGYREAYRQVIHRLVSKGGPRLISFSTNQASVNAIADNILCLLDTGCAKY